MGPDEQEQNIGYDLNPNPFKEYIPLNKGVDSNLNIITPPAQEPNKELLDVKTFEREVRSLAMFANESMRSNVKLSKRLNLPFEEKYLLNESIINLEVVHNSDNPKFAWKRNAETKDIEAALHLPNGNLAVAQEEALHAFDNILRKTVQYIELAGDPIESASRDATHLALVMDWVLTFAAKKTSQLDYFSKAAMDKSVQDFHAIKRRQYYTDAYILGTLTNTRFLHKDITEKYLANCLVNHTRQIRSIIQNPYSNEINESYKSALELFLLSYGQAHAHMIYQFLELADQYDTPEEIDMESLTVDVVRLGSIILENAKKNESLMTEILTHHKPMKVDLFDTLSAHILGFENLKSFRALLNWQYREVLDASVIPQKVWDIPEMFKAMNKIWPESSSFRNIDLAAKSLNWQKFEQKVADVGKTVIPNANFETTYLSSLLEVSWDFNLNIEDQPIQLPFKSKDGPEG